MDDEKQLDEFLSQAQTQTPPPPPPSEKTEEEKVEAKARQGKPLAQSILQKRTTLTESQLNSKIAGTIRKHPGIDETDLRSRLAEKIEESDQGEITEGDYSQIVNGLLSDEESQEPEEPGAAAIQPPAFISNSLQGLQSQTARLADWGASLATPGGIGALVFALLFFIWIIVPMNNGKTRMQLLWGVITGQVEIQPGLESVPGGSADFNNSTSSQQNDQNNAINTAIKSGGGVTAQTTAFHILPSFEVE